MADVESKELLVITEKAPEKGEKYNKDGHKVRVVQWYGKTRQGKAWSSVKLERRKFFLDGDETKMGKAEGFTIEDLRAIQPRWKEILALMQNPPPVEQKAAAGAGDDGIEEVQF